MGQPGLHYWRTFPPSITPFTPSPLSFVTYLHHTLEVRVVTQPMKSLSRACASITPLLSGARSQTARTLHFVSACPLLYSSGRHRSTSVCCRGERLFAIHSKVFSRASTLAERPPRCESLCNVVSRPDAESQLHLSLTYLRQNT